MPRSTSSTAPPACMTRSCGGSPAKICTAASSRITRRAIGSCDAMPFTVPELNLALAQLFNRIHAGSVFPASLTGDVTGPVPGVQDGC